MFEASSKLALYIRNHDAHVNFTGNKAVLGGAIFINDSTTASICDSNSLSSISVKTECFLQKFYFIDEGYNKTNTVIPMTSIIYFANNFANESGSILFGGLLDRCTISPFSNEVYTKEDEPIRLSYISGLEYFNSSTSIDYKDNTTISSQPVRICFCEPDAFQHNCSYPRCQ